jgi:hypothetical protein
MQELARCVYVFAGRVDMLPVQRVLCTVEMHISMAFVSLRIVYLNNTGQRCNCMFECGMGRGRAAATACDVVLTDLIGNVVSTSP